MAPSVNSNGTKWDPSGQLILHYSHSYLCLVWSSSRQVVPVKAQSSITTLPLEMYHVCSSNKSNIISDLVCLRALRLPDPSSDWDPIEKNRIVSAQLTFSKHRQFVETWRFFNFDLILRYHKYGKYRCYDIRTWVQNKMNPTAT